MLFRSCRTNIVSQARKPGISVISLGVISDPLNRGKLGLRGGPLAKSTTILQTQIYIQQNEIASKPEMLIFEEIVNEPFKREKDTTTKTIDSHAAFQNQRKPKQRLPRNAFERLSSLLFPFLLNGFQR